MSLSFERTQSVAIIGGGPGGYEAALAAAQLGAEVTLVERAGIGGSAVITDVVPSKSLIATADAAVAIAGASELGVQLFAHGDDGKPLKPEIAINLAAVNKRLLSLARQQSDDMRASLVEAGVRIISGHGRLEGDGRGRRLDGSRRHRLRPHRGRHVRRLGRRVAARAADAPSPTASASSPGRSCTTCRRCPSISSSSGSGVTGAEFASALHEPRREGDAGLEPRSGAAR